MKSLHSYFLLKSKVTSLFHSFNMTPWSDTVDPSVLLYQEDFTARQIFSRKGVIILQLKQIYPTRNYKLHPENYYSPSSSVKKICHVTRFLL